MGWAGTRQRYPGTSQTGGTGDQQTSLKVRPVNVSVEFLPQRFPSLLHSFVHS